MPITNPIQLVDETLGCVLGEEDTPLTIGTSSYDLIQGILFAGAGVLLAEKAYDEFTEATDNLDAVNQRRLDMAREVKEHNVDVTFPWIQYAMDFAFNIPIPNVEYSEMCSYYANLASTLEVKAKESYTGYLRKFALEDDFCNNSFGYYAGIMSVDSSYARTRFQERRVERWIESKAASIIRSHQGTFRNPDPYFGLLEYAGQIYGYIQTQSFGNLNGAISTFGYGIQQIAGYFGTNF